MYFTIVHISVSIYKGGSSKKEAPRVSWVYFSVLWYSWFRTFTWRGQHASPGIFSSNIFLSWLLVKYYSSLKKSSSFCEHGFAHCHVPTLNCIVISQNPDPCMHIVCISCRLVVCSSTSTLLTWSSLTSSLPWEWVKIISSWRF